MLNLPRIVQYLLDNQIHLKPDWYVYATNNHMVPYLDDSLITPNLTDNMIMSLWGEWSRKCGRSLDNERWIGYLKNDSSKKFMDFRRYLHNAWGLSS